MQKAVQKYRSTESKYKGGAREMYITYDLEQRTRAGYTSVYPNVKRVYIAGEVRDWQKGTFKKRTGREVYGVLIEYVQRRQRSRREVYTASRGQTVYNVSPGAVAASAQRFKQVVEIPKKASNIHFYNNSEHLPAQYQHALQNVR
jgi:hypothetical protein